MPAKRVNAKCGRCPPCENPTWKRKCTGQPEAGQPAKPPQKEPEASQEVETVDSEDEPLLKTRKAKSSPSSASKDHTYCLCSFLV